VSFPAFAQRVTVFGSTRNIAATSAGVRRGSASCVLVAIVTSCVGNGEATPLHQVFHPQSQLGGTAVWSKCIWAIRTSPPTTGLRLRRDDEPREPYTTVISRVNRRHGALRGVFPSLNPLPASDHPLVCETRTGGISVRDGRHRG